MVSALRNQTVNEFVSASVFSISHLSHARYFPSLWSFYGGLVCVLGFFYFPDVLVLLLRYIALSLCYVGDLYPILDLFWMFLKAESLTLSWHCLCSVGNEYDSAYEFIFPRQVFTLQAASWHSVTTLSRLTAMPRKNRRKQVKSVGI